MNIMLVSVTERTREIGLRKAVGARSRDILWQFLIEAMTLSAIGGTIGTGFGWGLSRLVGLVMQGSCAPTCRCGASWSPSASRPPGIFFGAFPAWRAARLNPIDALRHE